MNVAGVERILVVTSLGIGDSRGQVPWLFRLISKTLLRHVMHDHELQEEFVRTSSTRWTIVRPCGLTDGPATGLYVAGTQKDLEGGNRIARADVGAFLIEQIPQDTFLHQAPALKGTW